MAETKRIDQFADDADRDRALALDMMATMRRDMAELEASTARTEAGLRAENWRLIQEKAARDALPQVWRSLKAAARDIAEPYQNVLGWCKQGAIVAERRGSRWYVLMSGQQGLYEHVAAKRAK
jgi:hypothetical protein